MNPKSSRASLESPAYQVVRDPHATARRVVLTGAWNLPGIGRKTAALRRELGALNTPATHWDLHALEHLDTAGATLLWQAWGRRLPADLALSPHQESLFARIDRLPTPAALENKMRVRHGAVARLGHIGMRISGNITGAVTLLGYFALDLAYLVRHPQLIPWREISATIYKSGPLALAIVGLVGFLVGIVVAYQSALTLALYGANIYIVDLMGIGILRELGPLIAAIILAGRSGSAFTAQLGVMRVTQEIDALETFGVSPSLRLILPKIVALAFSLPFLVLWSDLAGLLGGMIIGQAQLGISYPTFISRLPQEVPQINLWIGIGKGFIFGIVIALVSGFYGLRIKPNTESLSNETTHSVVASVTLVILVDALFAFLLANVGLS